jgi:hypothetical protein
MARRTHWRNRIVGHGEEAPDQLLANPDNYRIHPMAQQDALSDVLRRVGVVQSVLVNRRTGHMIDGHLRVALAISNGEPSVPVTYVDLTEREESLVLATFDPLGAAAGEDRAKLEELLGLMPEEDAALARLLHAEKKGSKRLVSFTPSESFTVVVECASEAQQAALLNQLRSEGYNCRTE